MTVERVTDSCESDFVRDSVYFPALRRLVPKMQTDDPMRESVTCAQKPRGSLLFLLGSILLLLRIDGYNCFPLKLRCSILSLPWFFQYRW